MSTPLQDGGPAFPTEDAGSYRHGMSLRDWFAGQCLAGMIGQLHVGPGGIAPAVAQGCYNMADAMLEARRQQPDRIAGRHTPGSGL